MTDCTGGEIIQMKGRQPVTSWRAAGGEPNLVEKRAKAIPRLSELAASNLSFAAYVGRA